MLEPADKLAALSWFAKQWVGVVDDGAGVGDKLVDAFRESLNKNPSGEAWCADFVAFCADVAAQFVPIQRRLAEADLLNTWTTPIGSGVYLLPSAPRPGKYLGQNIVEA